ncbi:MAG: hypothetical protein O2805_04750 [Proteobacteria bacterium]|nr:hypothetical protein [Pseudomonadota bacterium]
MAVLVGIVEFFVLVYAAGYTGGRIKGLELEAVNWVLELHIDRHERAGDNLRGDERQCRVGEIDIVLPGRAIHIVICAETDEGLEIKVRELRFNLALLDTHEQFIIFNSFALQAGDGDDRKSPDLAALLLIARLAEPVERLVNVAGRIRIQTKIVL